MSKAASAVEKLLLIATGGSCQGCGITIPEKVLASKISGLLCILVILAIVWVGLSFLWVVIPKLLQLIGPGCYDCGPYGT